MNFSLQQVQFLAHEITGKKKIFGIPKSGTIVALYLAQFNSNLTVVLDPEEADVFVDDIIDSGKTKKEWTEKYGKPFFALVEQKKGDEWIVFPWERDEVTSAEDIPTRLLQYIGEDTKREGLAETPKRVLKAWKEWTSGYGVDPADVLKAFQDGAEGVDEMVTVKEIPFYSHCEHHLASIFGTATVAYIPDGKVVGLSKLSRLVDVFAKRLQVQERMTQQIANALMDNLEPLGVGVIIKARHMCMESRGICKTGSETVTTCLLGAFKDEASTRQEFMRWA